MDLYGSWPDPTLLEQLKTLELEQVKSTNRLGTSNLSYTASSGTQREQKLTRPFILSVTWESDHTHVTCQESNSKFLGKGGKNELSKTGHDLRQFLSE